MLNDSEIPSEGTGTDKPMATDLEIHAICNGNGVSYSREVVLRLIARLDAEITAHKAAEQRAEDAEAAHAAANPTSAANAELRTVVEDIILGLGKRGHGVVLSYNPMSQWDARVTTFEHSCGRNHETWCNGACAWAGGKGTAIEAIRAAMTKGGIEVLSKVTPEEAPDER